jgi:hypothetical protein
LAIGAAGHGSTVAVAIHSDLLEQDIAASMRKNILPSGSVGS